MINGVALIVTCGRCQDLTESHARILKIEAAGIAGVAVGGLEDLGKGGCGCGSGIGGQSCDFERCGGFGRDFGAV